MPDYLVRREQAKRSERTVQVMALLIAVVSLLAAAQFVKPIDNLRLEHQLTLDPESTKGLPPDIALLTKTGTLRAIAIDFLFIRLERLKEENKYYELNKLSDIICKLSPRFPSVWKYAAWNMAYNISVTQYSPEGRWYWVKKGVELLRNQGLRYNEKSIGLYLELAWIYWHKIGDFLDDHHWTYKKELAVEVERILGPPPVTQSSDEFVERFGDIARAPHRLKDLLATDERVVELVGKMAELDLKPDYGLLDFVARNMRTGLQIRDILKDVQQDTARTLHQSRIELLTDEGHKGALERLLACLRGIGLRDKFNMDPDWMYKLMQDYGPLDWRLPYAHALYWSSRGDMMTKGQLSLDENDSMNTVRYVFFGLRFMIQRGRLIFEPDMDDPKNSYLELMPDSRFIKHLHQAYLRFGEEQFGDDPRFVKGTAGPNYSTGHISILEDGIRQLYTEGGPANEKLAAELYEFLRAHYVDKDTGLMQAQYRQPLEMFVFRQFREELVSWKRANAVIGAWLYRSLKYLSLGEVESSAASLNRAKMGWEIYQRDKGDDPGDSGRRELPPIANMYSDAIVEFMQRPDVYILHRARLWNSLALDPRQRSYDRLIDYFEEACARNVPPYDPAKAFPEPEGMEEYRRNHPLDNAPDPTINHGEKA